MKKLLSLTLALAMTLSLAMPVVAEGLPEDTAAQQEVVQEVADDAPVETPEPTEPTAPSIYAQHGNCRNHAAFHYLKDN